MRGMIGHCIYARFVRAKESVFSNLILWTEIPPILEPTYWYVGRSGHCRDIEPLLQPQTQQTFVSSLVSCYCQEQRPQRETLSHQARFEEALHRTVADRSFKRNPCSCLDMPRVYMIASSLPFTNEPEDDSKNLKG